MDLARPCKPAVFLDRDGTLIEDVGFIRHADGIQLFPHTVQALQKLQLHYLLFVITNQSGIADGALTLDEAETVNRALENSLQRHGVTFADWYICPHNAKDRCNCRKPQTAFLTRAATEHHVDLTRSFIVGDHPHDAATGQALGVRGLYLLTGHGQKHRTELPDSVPVFPGLGEAADWILENPNT